MTLSDAPEKVWWHRTGRMLQYQPTLHWEWQDYIRADRYNALAKERDELQSEVERLREAIVSLRLDDDKREFDAFDSGWNAALDALQRKEGDE